MMCAAWAPQRCSAATPCWLRRRYPSVDRSFARLTLQTVGERPLGAIHSFRFQEMSFVLSARARRMSRRAATLLVLAVHVVTVGAPSDTSIGVGINQNAFHLTARGAPVREFIGTFAGDPA